MTREKKAHKETKVSAARESVATCVPRQHAHEEQTERIACLPQRPEGRLFESSTGQSESHSARLADRKKMGNNLRSQFVDFEDAFRHGGGTRERKGMEGRIRSDTGEYLTCNTYPI